MYVSNLSKPYFLGVGLVEFHGGAPCSRWLTGDLCVNIERLDRSVFKGGLGGRLGPWVIPAIRRIVVCSVVVGNKVFKESLLCWLVLALSRNSIRRYRYCCYKSPCCGRKCRRIGVILDIELRKRIAWRGAGYRKRCCLYCGDFVPCCASSSDCCNSVKEESRPSIGCRCF